MCKRDDLVEGAYLKDPEKGRLYEVRESPSRTHVRLTDVRSPVGAKRFTPVLIEHACRTLDVVVPAPDPRDTASVEEWGPCGTT